MRYDPLYGPLGVKVLKTCSNCLVVNMQYVLYNLAFLAFSLSITRFAEYVASGFALLYWKPRFKNFISSLL